MNNLKWVFVPEAAEEKKTGSFQSLWWLLGVSLWTLTWMSIALKKIQSKENNTNLLRSIKKNPWKFSTHNSSLLSQHSFLLTGLRPQALSLYRPTPPPTSIPLCVLTRCAAPGTCLSWIHQSLSPWPDTNPHTHTQCHTGPLSLLSLCLLRVYHIPLCWIVCHTKKKQNTKQLCICTTWCCSIV